MLRARCEGLCVGVQSLGPVDFGKIVEQAATSGWSEPGLIHAEPERWHSGSAFSADSAL